MSKTPNPDRIYAVIADILAARYNAKITIETKNIGSDEVVFTHEAKPAR